MDDINNKINKKWAPSEVMYNLLEKKTVVSNVDKRL